jgi:methylated-DNA-[protein]-cysteine S-methyltransferase
VQSIEVHVDTPIGPLGLVASERGLRRILWPGEPGAGGDEEVLAAAAQQLREYFAGTRRTFDLPLELEGTDFQRRAWLGLAEIPYGETRSYGEQARRLGVPRAARAVGAANGANPLPIVLPCHRLIGADGSLTGFGGGLDVKRWLLEHEATRREPSPRGSARSSR